MDEIPKVKSTRLLWIIPIFMGLLGGILMYIAVKDEDQRKANDAILVGTLCTLAWICLYVLLIGVFSMMNPLMNF